MSNRIRYVPEKDLDNLDNVALYEITKGNKPHDITMCNDLAREVYPFRSGFTNKWVLENLVQVPRVQSRFRVSPSPRKIPSYTLDHMALELLSKMAVDVRMPLEMMIQQQHEIRRTLPRFR
jgi:hypothetical protein